jgi:TPR repeat protein
MRSFGLLILALTLIAPARAEDADTAFRNGLSAFDSGAYERALTAWGALAKSGDARAQAGRGYMHYTGRGVPRDAARAAEYFDRAADQGESTAQLFLAMMHFRADGVPKNLPLALMWLELAMAGGQSEGFELRGFHHAIDDARRARGKLPAGHPVARNPCDKWRSPLGGIG